VAVCLLCQLCYSSEAKQHPRCTGVYIAGFERYPVQTARTEGTTLENAISLHRSVLVVAWCAQVRFSDPAVALPGDEATRRWGLTDRFKVLSVTNNAVSERTSGWTPTMMTYSRVSDDDAWGPG
jgi:hypothetical protein